MVLFVVMSEAHNFASIVTIDPAELDYSIKAAESLCIYGWGSESLYAPYPFQPP